MKKFLTIGISTLALFISFVLSTPIYAAKEGGSLIMLVKPEPPTLASCISDHKNL